MLASPPDHSKSKTSAGRVTLLAGFVVGAIALYMFGGEFISYEYLRDNRHALTEWRNTHYLPAALIFIAIYVVVTALSFPGGLALTLTGGFMFGWAAGAAYSIVGASMGAVVIFLVAKNGLGDALLERAGPFVKKAEAGFRRNEVSFLLILRLVPAVPFFAANLVPAFLGASTITYTWTTIVGIIPGGVVYASVGAGLGSVFESGDTPDLGLIFQPQILVPLLGLAALSAIPLVMNWFKATK
ncbi:MAG: TVP38/TMEM64 family protein [Pikeienuella sp.]